MIPPSDDNPGSFDLWDEQKYPVCETSLHFTSPGMILQDTSQQICFRSIRRYRRISAGSEQITTTWHGFGANFSPSKRPPFHHLKKKNIHIHPNPNANPPIHIHPNPFLILILIHPSIQIHHHHS